MDFYEVFDQVIDLLRSRGRVIDTTHRCMVCYDARHSRRKGNDINIGVGQARHL
jgi:hypothetical protein